MLEFWNNYGLYLWGLTTALVVIALVWLAYNTFSGQEEETEAAGAWVFNGGLFTPATATVLRPEREEVLVTDGPFLEGKEHVPGKDFYSTDAFTDYAVKFIEGASRKGNPFLLRQTGPSKKPEHLSPKTRVRWSLDWFEQLPVGDGIVSAIRSSDR